MSRILKRNPQEMLGDLKKSDGLLKEHFPGIQIEGAGRNQTDAAGDD